MEILIELYQDVSSFYRAASENFCCLFAIEAVYYNYYVGGYEF